MCAKIKEKIDASIEGKLRALYELQIIDSKIDRIRTVRGELPLEVQDLEDSVAGLETRVTNLTQELTELKDQVAEKTQAIKIFKLTSKNTKLNKVKYVTTVSTMLFLKKLNSKI
jgi:predicted  nucleic acid-binding Zn-ribbon protein